MGSLSHVIGIDDAPFPRSHRGDVPIVGAIFAGTRLEGIVTGKVRRDGANATRAITELVVGSRFAGHLKAVMLQGITFAGFNVVDIHRLHRQTRLPVLVIARRRPDLLSIRCALKQMRGGARKWRLIEQAGEMEPLEGVWVQRAGIDSTTAGATIRGLALHGHLPEPLRTAHIVASAMVLGESRHRP